MALNPSRIAGGQAIDRNLRAGQAKTLPQEHLAQDAAGKGRVAEAVLSQVGQWAQAGLLEGRAATTHWRLSGYLRQRHPSCRVDVNPMVLVPERVISAGAALAQMDLMLHLVRERLGMQVTDLTLRHLLLDERPSQADYMLWSQLHNNDPTVQGLETLVEESLPEVPPLGVLADKLHVSSRTLARRVRRATGKSALDLVQAVRLRRARHLLETTDLPLGEVAARVGYGDATALRKLTLRTLKVTPGRLRGRRTGPFGANS